MLTQLVVVVFLLAIVVSLVMALRALVRNEADDSRRLVKFLAFRVGLSALLLLLLGLAFYMGWLQPHGVGHSR